MSTAVARFGGLFFTTPMKRNQKHTLTEVPGLNEVWQYRGVWITTNEVRGYMTYGQIISKEPPHGMMRFTATTTTALQRMIDKHLDAGGKIKAL